MDYQQLYMTTTVISAHDCNLLSPKKRSVFGSPIISHRILTSNYTLSQQTSI